MKDEEQMVEHFKCIDSRIYELLMDNKKFGKEELLDTGRQTSGYNACEDGFYIPTTKKIEDCILNELKKDTEKHCNLKVTLKMIKENKWLKITFE